MTADDSPPPDAFDGRSIEALRRENATLRATLQSNERLARFNLFLKNVNAALVEISEPGPLLKRVCELAIDDAGLALAWAGIQDDALGRILPTSACGPHAGYASEILITTDRTLATSHGPTRRCMIDQKIVYVDDFQNDAVTAPWHDIAKEHGINSSASVPVIILGRSRRVLTFYSYVKAYFDLDMRDMLEDCARRLSLTMTANEAEVELHSTNELLSQMSTMALIGAWEMDAKTFRITGSDESASILDVDQSESFDDSKVLGFFPDAEAVKRSLSDALKHAKPFDLELRLTSGTGRHKWVRVIGHADVADGEVVRLYGAVQDITRSKQAEAELRHSAQRLGRTFLQTVGLATTLSELRDPYTSGHARRVGEIAEAIGRELGLDENMLEGLKVGGYLHDVGKINVPAEILSYPGKLSAIQFELIKGHAQAGFDVLKGVEFPWPVAQIALQHHERMDGSGYPRGLRGGEIILDARIVAVADVVESMASSRPYRPAVGLGPALAEIEQNRGRLYDIPVADACLRLFREHGYPVPS